MVWSRCLLKARDWTYWHGRGSSREDGIFPSDLRQVMQERPSAARP
jgi:hypothetical protein